MKHIISLALKYLRRQKLRTALTFLCIMLSCFVLCFCGFFCSSLFVSLKNTSAEDNGNWHIDFSGALREVSDIKAAADLLENHKYTEYSAIWEVFQTLNSGERNSSGLLSAYEIKADNISVYSNNINIMSRNEYEANETPLGVIDGVPQVKVPKYLTEFGYSEGDFITLTFTPIKAEFDYDSEEYKEVMSRIEEESGGDYIIKDEPGAKGTASDAYNSLKSAFVRQGAKRLPLIVKSRGKSVTVRAQIAGFYSGLDGNAVINEFQLAAPIGEISVKELDAAAKDFDKNVFIYYYCQALTRIIPNVNFDKAVEEIFTDLGFDPKTDFYRLIDIQSDYNTDVLAYELRGSKGIASIAPTLATLCLLILVIWAFMRFLIDNAFEVVYRERSEQFSALRIMGASKNQLRGFVFTEAMVYCLTAMTAGVLLAFFFTKVLFNIIRDNASDLFTFYVHPLIFLLMALLCILAIFISAYTSAFHHTRKLTLIESMSTDKPKRAKKAKKNHLNDRSMAFYVRYTINNLLRTKKSFIIPTVTMTVSVTLLTVLLAVSIFFLAVYAPMVKNEYIMVDFELSVYDDGTEETLTEEIDRTFADNDMFCGYMAYSTDHYIHKEGGQSGLGFILGVTRGSYEKNYAALTGIPYDSLRGKAIAMTEAEENSFQKLKDGIAIEYGGGKIPVIGRIRTDNKAISSLGSFSVMMIPFEDLKTDGFIFVDLDAAEGQQHKDMTAAINAFLTVDAGGYTYKRGGFSDNYLEGSGMAVFFRKIIICAAVFLLSMWAAGVLSMANTVNAGIIRRRDEFYTLRTLGLSLRDLRGIIRLETLIFAGFSAILGTVLGIGSYAFIAVMNEWGDKGVLIGIAAFFISIILNTAVAIFTAKPGERLMERELQMSKN